MSPSPPDRQRILADAALMTRIADGDTRAFESVVKADSARLVSLALALLGSRPDAEEVAQDALVRLWRQAPRWAAEARISTWLHRVAYRLAIDRLRRRRPAADPAEIEEGLSDPAPSPEATLLEGEREALIDRALARLPPRQRAAVVLAHRHGLSQAEGAAALELSEEAYESLLARGRRRLKALIAAWEGA